MRAHRTRGVDTSYRGQHQPLADTDPLWELGGSSDGTRSATIPPDVYDHPEWYGWGDDVGACARVVRAVRGLPDAIVRRTSARARATSVVVARSASRSPR